MRGPGLYVAIAGDIAIALCSIIPLQLCSTSKSAVRLLSRLFPLHYEIRVAKIVNALKGQRVGTLGVGYEDG